MPTLSAGRRPRFAVARPCAVVLAVCSCAIIAADTRIADLAPVIAVQAAAAPTPTRVGSLIAGTFNDAEFTFVPPAGAQRIVFADWRETRNALTGTSRKRGQ